MTTLYDQISEAKLTGIKPGQIAAAIIHYPEEYRCPACDSLIPPTMMKREDETHVQTLQLVRKVQIYCGHCNAAFAARFALRSGLLAQLDSVTRVNLDGLKQLKAELGVVNGDRQYVYDPQSADAVRLETAEERRERMRLDREELYDRITATELQLVSLKAAFRQMMGEHRDQCQRNALAASLPGWEPSGSLDQESCGWSVEAQARRIAAAGPRVAAEREMARRQDEAAEFARRSFDTSTSQLVG